MNKTIDSLIRNIAQTKAVVICIQMAVDNEHSDINKEVLSDALWEVLDNLSELDTQILALPSPSHSATRGKGSW